MIYIYLIIYIILNAGIVVLSCRYKAGYLYYPFLAALTFGGFAMPQFISLINAGVYPGYSLEKYIIMASLCIAAVSLGFRQGRKTNLPLRFQFFLFRKMDICKLKWLSFLYILIGGFFFILLYLSGAQFRSQYWMGTSVIYIFFSGFIVYGFIIALNNYLCKRNIIDLVLILVGIVYVLIRVVIHGRRSSAVLLFVIVLGLVWFRKRKLVPFSLIFAVIVGGLIVSTSMHAYRMKVADELRFSDLVDIDFIGNFIESYGESKNSEILNGCYIIETTDRKLSFDYGVYNWNSAVWTFIPRQLVGEQFKQSLMIPIDTEQTAYDTFGYVKNTGTTITGVADSYLAFSYAGCIKFFIIAYILGALYQNAERGSTIAILIYLLMLPKALVSFTHSTSGFSNELIMISVFLIPALVFCSSIDIPRFEYENTKQRNLTCI